MIKVRLGTEEIVDYKNREKHRIFEFCYCSMINSDQYATHRMPYVEFLKSVCV